MASSVEALGVLEDGIEDYANNNLLLNDFIKQFSDADILIIERGIWGILNCLKIEYDGRIDPSYYGTIDKNSIGEYLGKVKRSGIQENWKTWDATKLKIDTKIYKHKEENNKFNIIIAVQDEKYIPYWAVLLEEE